MDKDSPFFYLDEKREPAKQRRVHVLFCTMCHHVWKASGVSKNCLNCTNQGTVVSLVKYETEMPIT